MTAREGLCVTVCPLTKRSYCSAVGEPARGDT